ncbi:hypothetical protein CHS0354_006907 [Potamilus streckersoni]|uniref:Uncharacterized protein n=1 Tax=Potamilus streckersoni TaxID=2493646 RepID=A0AAE0WBU5_9BIVA|nr:hypothetical protein CHS0354_006907 [Potamilus streckersoni]
MPATFWTSRSGLAHFVRTPADCVKQLLQLRIIRPTEKDGVSFETGPNAILLSDTAIQNGQICNASEFPVLQMLYRQGMALPNHPNNTNVRPVLIGAARQIKSQMDYIYLGNYGIDSLTEIIDAGLLRKRPKNLSVLKNILLLRSYFSVVHSGQGDGWDIHRPSMSSILFHQGKVYLIDAGPNIKNILNAVGIGINEIVGIFQTHIHDDHFSGITSLMGLDHRLNFYTTQLIRHSALKKLSALLSIDEDVFSNFFNFIDLHPDEWNAIHDLEVKPFYSPHPIETVNFYFRCMSKCGYKTYAHLADTTSFRVLDGMVNDNPDQPGISRIMNERVRENYLTPADVKKWMLAEG